MEYREVTDVLADMDTWVRRSWVGRLFWHSVNVEWYAPPAWTGTSWEVEEPFRKGRSVFLRYSWSKMLVFGFWGKTEYDEAEVLLNATLHGRKRTNGEHLGWNDESYREGEFAGVSGPIFESRPGLRVRATVDAGTDE